MILIGNQAYAMLIRMKLFWVGLGCLLIVTSFVSGCAQVRPWQKGTLAHKTMDQKNGQEVVTQDFLYHQFDVREGSTGGFGRAGGGCGCN